MKHGALEVNLLASSNIISNLCLWREWWTTQCTQR